MINNKHDNNNNNDIVDHHHHHHHTMDDVVVDDDDLAHELLTKTNTTTSTIVATTITTTNSTTTTNAAATTATTATTTAAAAADMSSFLISSVSSSSSSKLLLLQQTLQMMDPILQFLTRRTGQDRILLSIIYQTIPPSYFIITHNTTTATSSTTNPTTANDENEDDDDVKTTRTTTANVSSSSSSASSLLLLQNIQTLCSYNILALHYNNNTNNNNNATIATSTKDTQLLTWDNPYYSLGFPLLPSTTTTATANNNNNNNCNKLHGSTKAAAKRRMIALQKIIQQQQASSSLSDPIASTTITKKKKKTSNETLHVVTPATTTTTTTSSSSIDDTYDVVTNQDDITATYATTPNRKQQQKHNNNNNIIINNDFHDSNKESVSHFCFSSCIDDKNDDKSQTITNNNNNNNNNTVLPDHVTEAIHQLLHFPITSSQIICSTTNDTTINKNKTNGKLKNDFLDIVDHITMSNILPQQVSYAGSNMAQESIYNKLSDRYIKQIPEFLLQAFNIDIDSDIMLLHDDNNHTTVKDQRRLLYSHQVQAIEAVMDDIHCSVCTGTGSGKSLCYLLPALTAAYNNNDTSLLLYPTKALAQDQLSKINSLLKYHPNLQNRIRPMTLDGDTTHMIRSKIHEYNIILTNPDILHTTVLPSWKQKSYQHMLSSIHYVAIDEAHIYDGIFGAHVAMILRRLVRIIAIATSDVNKKHENDILMKRITPIFIATSATLQNPAEHFRLLCPILYHPTKVISSHDDGSPRSAKHFLVWNPPVLQLDGTSTGKLHFPKPRQVSPSSPDGKSDDITTSPTTAVSETKAGLTKRGRKRGRSATRPESSTLNDDATNDIQTWSTSAYKMEYRRRHAAEETALLLARAVILGTRCIAFCKTRNLVEWVYTKTIDVLNSHPKTRSLCAKVESYRGGYTVEERRKIEEKLFQNRVLGVVGTNALELGVDIGGIDLTLHCGYPSSYTSLLQQAGRAGRGKDRLGVPSVAIVVCFSSPSEQQLWRRPASLLSEGIFSATSIPFQDDLVEGHLLCASEEFPLCGQHSTSHIAGIITDDKGLSDKDIFGETYDVALNNLIGSGAVIEEKIVSSTDPTSSLATWKAKVSFRKAWSRLSIRSIEPIHYAIVDLSHSSQGGRTNGIHDMAAVLDTIPYSRVFYHAHPGAIITHRGKKYEIVAMTHPPVFEKENYSYMRTQQLAAYVRPTTVRYFTRPLAKTIVTIVKQFEVIATKDSNQTYNEGKNSSQHEETNFAGCGIVSVKRQVRGYKKLSYINFSEIARTELSLPPIEFDTFGFYICADPNNLSAILGESYGPGVHALSHAILAVAPLFAKGLTRGDIECDHSFYSPNKVILFDERAGGSGCVQRLWKSFFQPNGILDVAVDLLKSCTSCCADPRYDGGCPACIHASQCSKFNMHLSRTAAIVIGERMMERVKETNLYKQTVAIINNEVDVPKLDTTPRRKARNRALQKAKEMQPSRDRQFVVSRPSWPMDGQGNRLECG